MLLICLCISTLEEERAPFLKSENCFCFVFYLIRFKPSASARYVKTSNRSIKHCAVTTTFEMGKIGSLRETFSLPIKQN